jgi:hypothetical protein
MALSGGSKQVKGKENGMKNRVLRDYSTKTEGQLGDFALHVATSLTGNVNFTTPTIPPATLTTQANGFNTAAAKALNGTPADTLDKTNKHDALIASLDQLATYVDLIANGNAAIILSSGFSLASSSARTPAVPGTTSILSVTNVASGKLGLDLQVAANAWAYIVEYTALPSGAKLTATFTNPHDVTLIGLTPGTIYSIRVQVMGSGNQITEWSDAVQHMAT